jgi:hypothetical protein
MRCSIERVSKSLKQGGEEEMKAFKIISILVLITLIFGLVGCKKAYECTDEWGCAEIGKGKTIKIGYVGP